MLRIALCDDDSVQRVRVAGMLCNYLEQRPETPGEVSTFASGQELLDNISAGGDFDLYILDVHMPGLSGMELGVRLRELGGSGAIICLASPGDYAPEPLKSHSMGYIPNPPEPEALCSELDRALEAIRQKRLACVFVKTKGGMRRLPLDELLYVELVNRVLRYHQVDGSIAESLTLRTSFQKAVEPILADGRFFRCGTSLAVNLHYVRGLDTDGMLMDNGDTIPLPKGMLNEARRRWSSFWRGDLLADGDGGAPADKE